MTLREQRVKSALVVPQVAISRTARACLRLQLGWRYFVDSKPYIFERYLPQGELLFKSIPGHMPLRIDPYDDRSSLPDATWVTEMFAAGRLRVHPKTRSSVRSSRHMMSEAEARELDPASVIRYHIMVEVDQNSPQPDDLAIVGSIDRVVALFPAEAKFFKPKPSVKAVREWLRNRGSYGDRAWRDCISQTGRSSVPRLLPETRSHVAQAAFSFWSDTTLNYWQAYTKLLQAIEGHNAEHKLEGTPKALHPPAFTTFRRYIDFFATFEAVRARYGDRAAKERFSVGKNAAAHRILETVQADHTVVDLIVWDDITGAPLGRPTLTVIIDVKSRCILGYYLSFDPPSLASIIECLKRCLLPKVNCAGSDEFPILQDIYGLPTLIVVDNALEFVGVSMQDAMNDLGVILMFPPVRTPEAKPFIERLFGTLNSQLFHRLKGTTFNQAGQKKRRGEYKPDASISLGALDELIGQAMYLYHISPHSGLNGRPPALVWQEDAMDYGLPVLSDISRLDAILAATEMRVVRRDGVELFDLQYGEKIEIRNLIEDLETSSQFDAKAKQKIKYNPLDLRCIWVFNPVKLDYVELPCFDQDYASGLSRYQHSLIKNYMAEAGLKFSSHEQRQKAFKALEEKKHEHQPGLLKEQKIALARLVAKAPIRAKLASIGLTVVPEIVTLPHDPLLARTSDGGARPNGARRGAAKARRTRAENLAREAARAVRLEAIEPDIDEMEMSFDEWEAYDDE